MIPRRIWSRWRLGVAGLVVLGCILLTALFATSSSRVPRYSDLVVVSGEIDPSFIDEVPGGRRGASIRVRLTGGGDLLHEEGDIRYREVANALRAGGYIEAWVRSADVHAPYPATMWQLRRNGQMIFTYEEAVAFRTGPQTTELILLSWGMVLMTVLALLRPGRVAPRSRHATGSHPLVSLTEPLWGIGVGVLFGGGGVWLLYRFGESRYSLDLLFGLIGAIGGGYALCAAASGHSKPGR